jgi:predicted AAA+ superfamily ATPase
VHVSLLIPRGRVYFWRTQIGDVVDFVVEHGRRVVGIEAVPWTYLTGGVSE